MVFHSLRVKTNSFFTPLKENNSRKRQASFYREACFAFYKEFGFYCIFKGFEEKLDYLTIVSLRSLFSKNNFVFLPLVQSVDFVYRLKGQSLNSVLFAFLIKNVVGFGDIILGVN